MAVQGPPHHLCGLNKLRADLALGKERIDLWGKRASSTTAWEGPVLFNSTSISCSCSRIHQQETRDLPGSQTEAKCRMSDSGATTWERTRRRGLGASRWQDQDDPELQHRLWRRQEAWSPGQPTVTAPPCKYWWVRGW